MITWSRTFYVFPVSAENFLLFKYFMRISFLKWDTTPFLHLHHNTVVGLIIILLPSEVICISVSNVGLFFIFLSSAIVWNEI